MPELQVEYAKFLESVEEEARDPEWAVAHHPAHSTLERYSPVFQDWVLGLEEKLWLQRAGYPLEKEDCSRLEWKCLAIFNAYKNEKALNLESVVENPQRSQKSSGKFKG